MGVIQRQGSKQGIVRIVSVLIGLVSMLWIYPLDMENYGYATFLYGTAALMMPLMSFGIPTSSIKFFKEYQNNNTFDNGMYYQMLLLHIAPLILFLLVFFIFRSSFYHLLEFLDMDAQVFRDNEYVILAISFLLAVTSTTVSYISNHGRIVVPSIVQDFGYKLFLPGLILAIYFGYASAIFLPYIIMGFWAAALLIIYLYGVNQKFIQWPKQWSFVTNRSMLKSILRYSTYGMLASLGALIALRIDTVMITGIIDKQSTGIYATIMMMAAVIDLPQQTIGKIAGPIISRSWTDNNVNEIESIYHKASINSLIFGLFIFMGIWFNLQSLFAISSNPEVFVGTSTVFLILALAKLVDAVTSINSHILLYSQWYRYNLLFLLFLAAVNIVLNIVFIKSYGILGAAMATGISMLLYNLMKYTFIKIKVGIQPFDFNTIKVIIIAASVFALLSFISLPENLLGIIMRSTIITALFIPLIYMSKVSLDFNDLIHNYSKKIFLR